MPRPPHVGFGAADLEFNYCAAELDKKRAPRRNAANLDTSVVYRCIVRTVCSVEKD